MNEKEFLFRFLLEWIYVMGFGISSRRLFLAWRPTVYVSKCLKTSECTGEVHSGDCWRRIRSDKSRWPFTTFLSAGIGAMFASLIWPVVLFLFIIMRHPPELESERVGRERQELQSLASEREQLKRDIAELRASK